MNDTFSMHYSEDNKEITVQLDNVRIEVSRPFADNELNSTLAYYLGIHAERFINACSKIQNSKEIIEVKRQLNEIRNENTGKTISGSIHRPG